MQPTNQNDDQPQGVPIEPYRGPLTVRLQAEKVARLTRVREVERPSVYGIVQPASLETNLREWWNRLYRNSDPTLRLIQRGTGWLLIGVMIVVGVWMDFIIDPDNHPPEYIRPLLLTFLFYGNVALLCAAIIDYIRAGLRSRNSSRPTFFLVASILAAAVCYCLLLIMLKEIDYWFGD